LEVDKYTDDFNSARLVDSLGSYVIVEWREKVGEKCIFLKKCFHVVAHMQAVSMCIVAPFLRSIFIVSMEISRVST
jgi:hypothetical protein